MENIILLNREVVQHPPVRSRTKNPAVERPTAANTTTFKKCSNAALTRQIIALHLKG